MAAHEKLSGVQFQYDRLDTGGSRPYHRLTAQVEGRHVGNMVWNSDAIRNVMVNPDRQRQGIGTGMWEEGHRLASENARIPKPKHSADRTKEGDAWARSVGGRLPRMPHSEDTFLENR